MAFPSIASQKGTASINSAYVPTDGSALHSWTRLFNQGGITLVAENSDNVIQLPSHFTIRQVERVHRQCEDALKGIGNLRIDASEVSKVDTAGLQLLMALKFELDGQHCAIDWIAVTDELRGAANFFGMQALFEQSAFA